VVAEAVPAAVVVAPTVEAVAAVEAVPAAVAVAPTVEAAAPTAAVAEAITKTDFRRSEPK
jgi:hypothetical protein